MKTFKRILIYSLLSLTLVLAPTLGIFTGNLICDKHFKINKYSGINVDELYDDISLIKYENKTPDQLSATEAYNIAILKLQSLNSYKKEIVGEMQTNMGIKQYAHSISTKDGDTYTQAISTFSSIMKSAGSCTYKKNEDIILHRGTPNGNNLDSVSWDGETEHYTFEEYSRLMGQDPTVECMYIVSSKTAQTQSPVEIENGTYKFTITLDPLLSTVNYVNKIAFLSGVDAHTVSFSSVMLSFTLDKNFQILSEYIKEVYSLKYSGLTVTLTSTYNNTFNY